MSGVEFVKHATLAEALQAAWSECGYVQKKTLVDNKYLAAGESEVLETIRPVLVRHGVIGPIPLAISSIEVKDGENKSGGKARHCVVVRTFRVLHADSEQFLDIVTAGEATDSGLADKSVAKALTQAKKFAVRELMLVETGTDADYLASERGAENAPDFRRVATAIESAKDPAQIDKALAGLEKYKTAFDGEQLEKLRAAADRKLRSFPGQAPRPQSTE